MKNTSTTQTKPGLLELILSVVAAFCGIQSNKNHDRDEAYIEQVGFKPYIIIGILLTLTFVFCIYFVVQITLS
jgi:hypothetical protein